MESSPSKKTSLSFFLLCPGELDMFVHQVNEISESRYVLRFGFQPGVVHIPELGVLKLDFMYDLISLC